jgi:hypothetical protein
MAWNAGYMTDVNYTFGYYPELNPVRAVTAVQNSGRHAPQVRNACELGFGQGMSILSHAAAQPDVQWWGTDFNPSQADFAQELAAKVGTNVHLFDQSFEEFCSRDDLPEFEYIGLHGIWTWISDENRRIIVDFARRKLAVGGILYISYNTLPGWAAPSPIRQLLKLHDKTLVAPGAPVKDRIDAGVEFLGKLAATNPAYFRAYPVVAERIESMKKLDRHYLAHEYLNEHWEPMYFAQMAQWLDDAKLTYACSANLAEHQDAANLTTEQAALVTAQTDIVMRETLRDWMVAQQFRRDIWIRGVRPYGLVDHITALRRQRYLLTSYRPDVKLTFAGLQGEVGLQPAVYEPLLDALGDNQIKTFVQLEQAGAAAGLTLQQVVNAVGVMLGMGAIVPVQDDKTITRAKPRTDKLNAELMSRAHHSTDVTHLASPVTGGGVSVNRVDQLFLAARNSGRKTTDEWADYIWAVFAPLGHKLIKDGATLATAEENLVELKRLAKLFNEKYIPLHKALGII